MLNMPWIIRSEPLGQDMIQATPILKQDDATVAMRVVIRDKGEGQHMRYIVHYQCWQAELTPAYFHDGFYTDDFSSAVDNANQRWSKLAAYCQGRKVNEYASVVTWRNELPVATPV